MVEVTGFPEALANRRFSFSHPILPAIMTPFTCLTLLLN